MRKSTRISVFAIPALAAALSLGGCANDQRGNREVGGTLMGAAIGGFLGSLIGKGNGRLAATAIGTLAGAAIGNSVGRQLDEKDRMMIRNAEYQAYSAPLQEEIVWNNSDSGNYGSITPIRDRTRPGDSAYCREFQSEIVVGGEPQQAYGTACRQPDGSWKIVN